MTTPSTAIGRADRHTAVGLTATVGLGAAAWIVAIQRMRGMDMGVATTLGSLPSFLSVWVPMMAAMMLPGIAPAARRLPRARDITVSVASYLAVWAVVGIGVYALYRPHGTAIAGGIVIAAAAYELTPLKRRFREMCLQPVSSGLELGLCCVGCSIGLMLVMVALGVMSITWMALTAAVVLAQKLLAPRAAIDIPVAAGIAALGIFVIVAPSSVPGLVRPM